MIGVGAMLLEQSLTNKVLITASPFFLFLVLFLLLLICASNAKIFEDVKV